MAYSSFMPANNSSVFPKRTHTSSLDDDTVLNPFATTAIRTAATGDNPNYGLPNGFGSNYGSSENVPFFGNSSKFSKVDSTSEFYNPWSHRTFLNSRQVASNEDQLRNTANPGFMSPSAMNLDALVSKLVSEDDNVKDYTKANDSNMNCSRFIHAEHSDPLSSRSHLVDQLNYWSIEDAPKVHQQLKPEMNLFAQSKPCFDSNVNYAGGDFNNKVYQYNTQVWKSDRNNLPKQTERLFNNCTLNTVQQSFNQYANIQKEKMHLQYLQAMQQSRQQAIGNTGPTQIRSIRAAVRNSSISGVAPQNDLYYRLERCYEQFRFLERERKKIEHELSVKFPGKKVSSANSIPIARLPQNPSRIDRLIVDQYREHAKVITLIAKMETLQGNREMHLMIHDAIQKWLEAIRQLQHERKDDLLTSRTRTNDAVEDLYDYICSQVSLAVQKLCVKTRAARTALWCSANSTLENKNSAADLV